MSLLTALTATHTVPAFTGARSRMHRQEPLWRLLLKARLDRARTPRLGAQAGAFVQFVGFPRSGHSLIGAILDAHPDAVVAHELDAMGLLAHGAGGRDVLALVARNAAAFERAGRYWNGFSYAIPGRHAAPDPAARIFGDKKGDWVTRRVAAQPSLLERAPERMGLPCKYILVVRHPFDNVATMSLRKGRVYDRLRIDCADGQAFRAALAQAQADGEIADTVLDAELEDYVRMAEAVQAMKARVPAADWHEIPYEAFTHAPDTGIRDLLGFLDLPADEAFVADACGLVRHSTGRSRTQVAWTDDQRRRLAGLIAETDFLQRYADDE